MKTKEVIKKAREVAREYRVTHGGKLRLKDYDPADTMDSSPRIIPAQKKLCRLV